MKQQKVASLEQGRGEFTRSALPAGLYFNSKTRLHSRVLTCRSVSFELSSEDCE